MGAAWYTHGWTGFRSTPVDTSAGNKVKGTLGWNTKKKQWNIIFEDMNSGKWSTNFSVDSPEIGSTNLDAFCTLENGNVIDDNDTSGTIFKDISLKNVNLVDVTPGWTKETHPTEMGLTDLDVTWTSDEKEVTLKTKNG